MIGLLIVGGFIAVVLAYMCAEYLLIRFDARRRVLVGEGHTLLIILGANFVSFALIWASAMIFIFASGSGLYYAVTVICIFAQAVWLSQHLWFYYRDHLRLRYKQ